MGRPTLQSIADRADCSLAVVSSVLNKKAKGNIRVSEQTRSRILGLARELNYRPNFAGRSLANQSTRTVGVYVTPHPFASLAQQYEGGLFRGIERACRVDRFSLLFLNLVGNESPESCLEQIQEQRVDGLIVIQVQPFAAWTRAFVEQSQSAVPTVIIGPTLPDLRVRSIDLDNTACIDLSVAHLVELGHRNIGFLGSCLAEPSVHAKERLAAFAAALRRHGLPVHREYLFDAEICPQTVLPEGECCQIEGYCGADFMLRLPEAIRPTAFIAYNDESASGAYRRLYELHKRIPEDFSLIGIDNERFCTVLMPRLTSIKPPLDDMGYRATMDLIGQLKDEMSEPSDPADLGQILFKPELIIRESTGRVRPVTGV